jgi:hypothetical protein
MMQSLKFNDTSGNKIEIPATGQMKFVGVFSLLMMLPLIAGCANGPAQGLDVCSPWQPIYLAQEDRLTQETARSLITHNRTGQALCGWSTLQERN